MTNDNRKKGTGFERDLCVSLAGYGFWCHNMAQNAAGQPFDVIAARNGEVHPIDCKVCENDRFCFSRIESNQDSAMALWEGYGNGPCWFALRMSDYCVYFISYDTMIEESRKSGSLSRSRILQLGIPLTRWVEQR